MKRQLSITIVICSRNNPAKLKMTLDKLLSLLPDNFSVVLVDQSHRRNRNNLPEHPNLNLIHTPGQKRTK